MKISRTLQIVSMLILGIGQASGALQIYAYSGPVSGSTDVALSPDGLGNGVFTSTFGTLSETLYYDTVAQTLEEVGSVTVNPSSGSFNIVGSPIDPGLGGSATLTVGINGSFSFDHTTSGVTPGGGGVGGGPASYILVPVSGSGIYGGQAFSGSWNIDILVLTEIDTISQTTLTFHEVCDLYPRGINVIPGTDLQDAVSDTVIYTPWQLSGVATAIPEPKINPIPLLILVLSTALLTRHRCASPS